MTTKAPAGQGLRQSSGAWEKAANTQQRQLVQAYDSWSAAIRRRLRTMAKTGGTTQALLAAFNASIGELEGVLLAVVSKGQERALRAAGGPDIVTPAVQSTLDQNVREGAQAVSGSLVPKIATGVRSAIGSGAAAEPRFLRDTFQAHRSSVAQFAGGFWQTLFGLQRQLGRDRQSARVQQGLEIEPVRWVLNAFADHCADSPGFFGCPGLAGEYPGGWDTLPTVPAGQVTCRGNCRCYLEIKIDGKWQRGLK